MLPKPEKPLKILTIDGGGLQGISTLLILNELLKEIARNNRVPDSKPRPCDVFDVIAGIGQGGWLALLLGRFQMDVPSALADWYNLIECIAPRSKTEQLRMRLMQRSYFDTDRLVEQIDQLTEFYKTDQHMYFTPPRGTRCKHVFVSALKIDSKDTNLEYYLFRTYDCPKSSKLLAGPPDPRKYKISHAFGVTGAAKYFTPPWKETTAKKTKLKFLDTKFPSPHNITELALDEVWGLYGVDVEISVIVNIGPGIPNAADCKKIAKRFSWGSKAATKTPPLPKKRGPSGAKEATTASSKSLSHDYEPIDEIPRDEMEISHLVRFDPNRQASIDDTGSNAVFARHNTFGSEQDIGIKGKLRRDESKVEDDIRTKIHNVYKTNKPPYYRLAPEKSAPGTAQNDTCSSKASLDFTMEYLRHVEEYMKQVGQRISSDFPVGKG
ncbi:hypothetical protein MMC29_002621 [Sticta canariensis]|nr:hypothetical protein [Sticta canariensis]